MNKFINSLYQQKERLFQGLARLLPDWLTPNMLSTLRAVLIVPIYILYRNNQTAWVIIVFIIALITDVLDGVHARANNKISNLGKLLDPAADKILFIGLFLMLAPGRVNSAIIYLLISLEIFLVLLASVIGPLAARILKIPMKLGANAAGKIKMSLEGLAILVLLCGGHGNLTTSTSEIIFWLAIIAALASIILHLGSLRQLKKLAKP